MWVIQLFVMCMKMWISYTHRIISYLFLGFWSECRTFYVSFKIGATLSCIMRSTLREDYQLLLCVRLYERIISYYVHVFLHICFGFSMKISSYINGLNKPDVESDLDNSSSYSSFYFCTSITESNAFGFYCVRLLFHQTHLLS